MRRKLELQGDGVGSLIKLTVLLSCFVLEAFQSAQKYRFIITTSIIAIYYMSYNCDSK
jgi:hypothetical protein